MENGLPHFEHCNKNSKVTEKEKSDSGKLLKKKKIKCKIILCAENEIFCSANEIIICSENEIILHIECCTDLVDLESPLLLVLHHNRDLI
jgi:hypothetical protein